MNKDEMMKSVMEFATKAKAKKEELFAKHQDALREILELRQDECLGIALSNEFCYVRGRESWLSAWWCDVFGPKPKRPTSCYGHLGKKALCGPDSEILLYLCADGEEFLCIPLRENGNTYAERAPVVHDVAFYNETMEFSTWCSPDDVAMQLRAYKKYCKEFEDALRKIHTIVKKMKAYEFEQKTNEAKRLASAIEDL